MSFIFNCVIQRRMWQIQWSIWRSRVKPPGKDRGTRRRSPVGKRKPFIRNATCSCTKRCWCTRANSISRMSSRERATRLLHERKIVSHLIFFRLAKRIAYSRIVHSVLVFFFYIGCLACANLCASVCDKIYRFMFTWIFTAGDYEYVANALYELGKSQLRTGDVKVAFRNFSRLLAMAKRIPDPEGICNAHKGMALAYKLRVTWIHNSSWNEKKIM